METTQAGPDQAEGETSQALQERSHIACQRAVDALDELSGVCYSTSPQSWPHNFIAVLARLNVFYMAGQPKTSEWIAAYSAAFNSEAEGWAVASGGKDAYIN